MKIFLKKNSDVTVYKDISRSDGHVDKSNNQIYQIVALEN